MCYVCEEKFMPIELTEWLPASRRRLDMYGTKCYERQIKVLEKLK